MNSQVRNGMSFGSGVNCSNTRGKLVFGVSGA